MSKETKNRKESIKNYDANKPYSLEESLDIVKKITFTKFDATVDMVFKLGVDPKKADQMIRSTVSLPHGTGKNIKILALCNENDVKKCEDAGADYVGLEEYLEKIKSGWLDFDVIICHPSLMGKLGPLGRLLGPKGLMPNPKSGTVSVDVAKSVSEFKKGKIDFRTDKNGNVHVPVGKISFDNTKLKENITEVYNILLKLKPSSAKGKYFENISISSTMSHGVKIDANAF